MPERAAPLLLHQGFILNSLLRTFAPKSFRGIRLSEPRSSSREWSPSHCRSYCRAIPNLAWYLPVLIRGFIALASSTRTARHACAARARAQWKAHSIGCPKVLWLFKKGFGPVGLRGNYIGTKLSATRQEFARSSSLQPVKARQGWSHCLGLRDTPKAGHLRIRRLVLGALRNSQWPGLLKIEPLHFTWTRLETQSAHKLYHGPWLWVLEHSVLQPRGLYGLSVQT